jgi:NAD-dependent dihydropyrimidine dehydrogenase PreA subunit
MSSKPIVAGAEICLGKRSRFGGAIRARPPGRTLFDVPVVVHEERCIKGCHICVESCPVDCLAINPATGKSHMKYDDCWYCLACEVDCPTNAITVKIPFLIR